MRASSYVLMAATLWGAGFGCGESVRAGRDAAATEVATNLDSASETEAVGGDSAVTSDSADTATAADAPVITNVPGTYHETLEVDGEVRTFIIYVPPGVADATPVPVVFMLHGTSQDGQHFYDESGWRAVADSEGIIAVFPDALTYCYHDDQNHNGVLDPDEIRVTTKWTHGALGQPDGLPLCTPDEVAALSPASQAKADHPFVDDVNFTDALRAHLEAAYRVDAKRFYVTGFSNGAAFAQRLLVERAHVFAAFAANSGALNIDPVPATRAASLYFTLGNQDAHLFPPDALPLTLSESLVADADFGDRFVKPLLATMQLASTYTFTDAKINGTRVLRWLYATSLVGASNVLDFHVIEGLPHVYPDPMPAALWEFFKGQSLD